MWIPSSSSSSVSPSLRRPRHSSPASAVPEYPSPAHRPPRLLLFAVVWTLLATTLGARECVLRILHTSDLHANLTGDDICPTSFAQLSTVLKQLRAEAPGPVIHIDTGDTIEGSLAGAIDRGPRILQALAATGCDIWVPGNHEFDFGCQNFLELCRQCPMQLLCGNLWPKGAPIEKRYTAGKVYHLDGACVAVIGLTASYLPNWYLDEFRETFEVESAVEALRRILPEIKRQKPDAIILGIHQGLTSRQNDPRGVNEVAALAYRFPEIDLILGGHTHRAMAGRHISHSWYLQPGAHGEYVGVAELTINLDEHRVANVDTRLVRPVLNTPPDPQVQEQLADLLTETARQETTLLHSPLSREVSAKGRPGVSCPLSELICIALAEATGAEVALHGTLSDLGLPAGKPITGAELFTVIPYENTAITAEVTAEELAQIITEQWSTRKVYTYCGIWNADAVVDAAGVAQLIGIGANHAAPEPDRRYRIVLNSHTAAGGGRFPVLRDILASPDTKCTDTRLNTREILGDWLRKHPEDFQIRPYPWIQTRK